MGFATAPGKPEGLIAPVNTAQKRSGFVRVVCAGLGCLIEPGMQPLPDLLRGVGAAAALGPDDDHAAGGDAGEGC
jgi:hypothetical protein